MGRPISGNAWRSAQPDKDDSSVSIWGLDEGSSFPPVYLPEAGLARLRVAHASGKEVEDRQSVAVWQLERAVSD